jgi:putative ABC transport system permease protein
MNIQSSFITAIRALNKNRLRSGLTSVGIIIGVSSVIMMVGIGNSATVAVKDKINNYGVNAMAVYDSGKVLEARDIENLRRFPQVKYVTPIIYRTYIQTKFQNRTMNSRIYGVNNDYFKIKDWELQSGRRFTEMDVLSTERVVIIGETVQSELLYGYDPLGQIIVIKDVPFKVIGVLVEIGQSFTGRDFDNILVMPYTTASLKITSSREFNEIHVATHSEDMIDETVDVLKAYFRSAHSIYPGGMNDFKVKTSKENLKNAELISNILAILLTGIASISLFVGGVGIMNIMLVSVSERTREIGIRMAIGAKKSDILIQFLIESVTLSSVGGIVGILFGLFIYYMIIYFVKWPFILSVFSIMVSFSFSCAVGIFFGYYPARKASNLKPIDALRFE